VRYELGFSLYFRFFGLGIRWKPRDQPDAPVLTSLQHKDESAALIARRRFQAFVHQPSFFDAQPLSIR
jgi:hypothetical protein